MNTAARSLSLRQRTLAKGVGVVMGVVLLYLYVGRPLWKRERGLRAERRDLDARIEQAEQLLRLEGALRAEWEKHRTDVAKLIQHHSPPAANPLLWTSEFVYRHARAAGVNVDGLSEIKAEIPAWAKPPEKRQGSEGGEETAGARKPASRPARRFVPYAVQLSLSCGYHELKRFLAAMQAENPIVFVSQLSIVGRDSAPEQHLVRLTLEWPRLQENMRGPLEQALTAP